MSRSTDRKKANVGDHEEFDHWFQIVSHLLVVKAYDREYIENHVIWNPWEGEEATNIWRIMIIWSIVK